MPKLRSGKKEAAKVLSQMDLKSRQRIIDDIASKDPEMARYLKENLVTFEDLRFLTTKMLMELLREIDILDLGMSLKISSKETREHILNNVSSGIKRELNEVLNGPPKKVSDVEKSVEKIMSVVRKKVDEGSLVLKQDDSEKYV